MTPRHVHEIATGVSGRMVVPELCRSASFYRIPPDADASVILIDPYRWNRQSAVLAMLNRGVDGAERTAVERSSDISIPCFRQIGHTIECVDVTTVRAALDRHGSAASCCLLQSRRGRCPWPTAERARGMRGIVSGRRPTGLVRISLPMARRFGLPFTTCLWVEGRGLPSSSDDLRTRLANMGSESAEAPCAGYR